ncbi:ankyrin repeat protein [Trypanosoma cruzi]|uniref:Ankyrin repeat protein, putative n=2 Tax=Trypanosoma cruzi TaxID=5693 RepID=Q4CR69_TRYCC|nr:ankyrin repeat protein, putative [Trypanosoma cruzi]EAN82769.1 ankyrin repeat protein, putative [Trypanosoma cruzi]RNC62102.1 ankyrin repeat protein [Trypanosoma cruzi]|eukprot:XP_804620.1 ankyrin repeat protein [Trypanosoma cruzi strain CL Brener]
MEMSAVRIAPNLLDRRMHLRLFLFFFRVCAHQGAARHAPMETGNQRKETIYDACRLGNEARVKEYVRHGGCVTERDANRMTLLHHAAFSGKICIVDAILSAQPMQTVDLDAADAGGWTPLHYAAERGFTAVVERLLDEGANPNARDEMKRTPLHLAAGAGHVGVLQILLKNGAMPSAKNVAGLTALACAGATGQVEAVSVLEQQ